jgi:hypothetical protein
VFVPIQAERDGVDAAQRVLGGHSAARPTGTRLSPMMHDEFNRQAVRVAEGEHLSPEAVHRLLIRDVVLEKAFDPEAERAFRH